MMPVGATRRRGKIARLPYAMRCTVCEKLRDGETYVSISDWLTANGHPDVTPKNVESWAKPDAETGSCGYADWLAQEAKMATLERSRDFALSVVREGSGGDVHEAALNLAASELFDTLVDFDPQKLRTALADKPEMYLELVNSIARLSKPGLDFAKYREQVRERKEAIAAQLSAAKGRGGITDETFELIERELKLL